MDNQDLLSVLKKVKSICSDCKGTGIFKKDRIVNLCTCCNGKGYHTWDELVAGKGCKDVSKEA